MVAAILSVFGMPAEVPLRATEPGADLGIPELADLARVAENPIYTTREADGTL